MSEVVKYTYDSIYDLISLLNDKLSFEEVEHLVLNPHEIDSNKILSQEEKANLKEEINN